MIALALSLQVLLFAAVCVLALGRRDASLFQPLTLYLVFHGLVFVLRPIAVHLFGLDEQWGHMRFTPDETQFVRTLAAASVGLLAFAAGSALAGRAPTAPAAGAPAVTPAQAQALGLTLILLLPLALYGAYRDAAIFGTFVGPGGAGLIQRAESAQGYFHNTTAYVVKAHNLLIPLAAVIAWLGRFRLLALLPLMAVIGYRLYLGSRWGMVVALGVVLLLYLHQRGWRWPPLRLAVLAVPLLAAFYVVGENRDVLRKQFGVGETRFVQERQNWPEGIDRWDTPSFANFDFLAYVVAVVPERSRTHTYFTQHLELFTRPIPRMLWPGKPYGPPIKLVDLNAHGWFGTRTVSLVGDGWRSAGWLGVVLTCGGVGWLLAWAHRWFRRRADRLFPVALYACYLPTAIMWFRGGELVNAVRFAVWMTAPILVWWGLSALLTHVSRRRAPTAAPP